MSYVRSYNPVWYFVSLDGEQLDDSYYFFVLQNDFPYLPATVTHDSEHTIPWNSPIQFNANGTLPVDIYYDPAEVYRLEIRRGDTQSDELVYLIQNYVPGDDGNAPSPGETITSDNQISNPQFSLVDFDPSFEATVAGTYPIAPGWDLILTGSGTVSTSITREAIAGDQNIDGNPPYVLSFVNVGWSSAILRQRFNNVSGIWANQAINANLVGISESAGQLPITLSYVPSTGSASIIKSDFLLPSVYSVIGGGIELGDSVNSDSGDTAYVDFEITLPPVGAFKISNIQLVAGDAALATPVTTIVPYIQDTLERQQDHLFHYYDDSILLMPKSSILTGWNFGLNPWQFISTTPANVAANSYTADQTIVMQQAYITSSTANNVSAGQASLANDYGFQVTAVTANNQFGLLQYIDPATVRPYWGYSVSSLVRAAITTTHGTVCKFKMRLIYKAGLPETVDQTHPIASWVAGSDPVFSAGWTGIEPLNDPEYTLTSSAAEYAFNSFILPTSTNANMTLGILIYTVDNMDESATADLIVINDASLVRNDFAIASNPKTFDQGLQECQFYYEKSYDVGILPGSANTKGQLCARQSTNDADPIHGYVAAFGFNFNTIKRADDSIMQFYSPSAGTADRVDFNLTNNGGAPANSVIAYSTFFPQTKVIGQKSYFSNYGVNTEVHSVAQAPVGQSGYILFHFTADCRMGI